MYTRALMTVAIMVISAAPAQAEDRAANSVYERMQSSSTASDPEMVLEKVFGSEATYLPGHKELGIERRDTFLRMMAGSQQHLRKAGGAIDIKFRVIDRKRLGGVYVDSGYMRTTIRPKKDGPEQVSYGKFLTVIAKQRQGHWAFIADADSETPAANFENARPLDGVKFDQ